MPSLPDADILILGGGCAGLSLAAHLAGLGQAAPRTIVLEPRQYYVDDRTFSGWRGRPHLFSSRVTASWNAWRIGAGGVDMVRSDSRCPYETIRAGAFYDEALHRIAGSARVLLRQGITAYRTGAGSTGAWVETSHGKLRAQVIVDTRPPAPHAGAGLLQTFTGCEIETDEPCFDPATVDLMLFDPPSAQHVSFIYGLNFSPTRALIELTRFAPGTSAPPTEAETLIRIAERVGRGFRVLRTERGTLAMRPGRAEKLAHPRLLRLGTLAGAARPATGYAFATIQLQAEALAACLRTDVANAFGWQPRPLPAWLQHMDRLFLRVLRQDPARGPDLFHSLFKRCPPATLVRFLSGTGTMLDAARVAGALPPAPFIAALAPRQIRLPGRVRAAA